MKIFRFGWLAISLVIGDVRYNATGLHETQNALAPPHVRTKYEKQSDSKLLKTFSFEIDLELLTK